MVQSGKGAEIFGDPDSGQGRRLSLGSMESSEGARGGERGFVGDGCGR